MPDQAATRTLLEQLVEDVPDLAVKGRKMPYLAVNGNMFAFADPGGALCLRFDDATRAALAGALGTGPVMQYGAVMRGYVEIPHSVRSDRARLSALFADCLAHARALKPKPTKR